MPVDSDNRWPAILSLLTPDRWMRAEDIARMLGISPRTVYRDMQRLMEAGAAVEAVPGQGYRLDAERMVNLRALTDDEAVALAVGAAWSAAHLDDRIHAAAETARRAIEERLPDRLQARIEALYTTHHRTPPVLGRPTESVLLHRLQQATGREQTVRIHPKTTEKAPSPTPITMDPYGLVRHGSAWQIVGYVHGTGRVRHVPVERLAEVEVTDATFERPAGYRTRTPAHRPPPERTVRVRFRTAVVEAVTVPPAAALVERSETDAGVWLTLKVEHERDIVPWLLSWGAQVYVGAPAALRQRVAEEAQQIADQYTSAPTLLS